MNPATKNWPNGASIFMPIQDRLVKELKYDPELVKLAMKALGM